MANWPDPRTSATGYGGASTNASEVAFDAGLRSYMLSIYNYMASGVLVTGIVALLFASSGLAEQVLVTPLRWLIMLAPLAFVMVLSFGIHKLQTSTAQMLYWAFAVVMGLSMSSIFLVFTGVSIAQTFFATAAAFVGLSLYGYTTKKDLSGFGTFLIMGVIFAGLTAYDTQRLKSMYAQIAGTDMMGKAVIMGALSLYLDFVNMFTFLLQLLGNRE